MSKPHHVDPLDTLGAAYENMYEHVAKNIHKVKNKTAPLLHELIDEAKQKALELEELTEDDAKKLTKWLHRDYEDVIHYISETKAELKDWLGFETALIESDIIQKSLETADKAATELLRIRENTHQHSSYHTDEITGPGTLLCDSCQKSIHFYKAGSIPPCPRCSSTTYHRIKIN